MALAGHPRPCETRLLATDLSSASKNEKKKKKHSLVISVVIAATNDIDETFQHSAASSTAIEVEVWTLRPFVQHRIIDLDRLETGRAGVFATDNVDMVWV